MMSRGPGGLAMPESAALRKDRKPFGFFVDVDVEGSESSIVAGPYDDGLQVADSFETAEAILTGHARAKPPEPAPADDQGGRS